MVNYFKFTLDYYEIYVVVSVLHFEFVSYI